MLSIKEMKELVPQSMAKGLTEDKIADLVRTLGNPETLRIFRDSFITYRNLADKGNYSLDEYINAVKYMTYIAMGCNNKKAYTYTFPERMERLRQLGKSNHAISAHVAGYGRSKLITEMRKQFAVPLYIMNLDVPQKVVHELMGILKNSRNDLARVKAADTLLAHLAPPVDTKISVEVGVKHDSEYEDMMASMRETAAAQRAAIEAGQLTARDVAESRIIEGVVRDVS